MLHNIVQFRSLTVSTPDAADELAELLAPPNARPFVLALVEFDLRSHEVVVPLAALLGGRIRLLLTSRRVDPALIELEYQKLGSLRLPKFVPHRIRVEPLDRPLLEPDGHNPGSWRARDLSGFVDDDDEVLVIDSLGAAVGPGWVEHDRRPLAGLLDALEPLRQAVVLGAAHPARLERFQLGARGNGLLHVFERAISIVRIEADRQEMGAFVVWPVKPRGNPVRFTKRQGFTRLGGLLQGGRRSRPQTTCRQAVLAVLQSAPAGGLTVEEIEQAIGVGGGRWNPRSIENELGRLRRENLVVRRADGRYELV